MAEEKYFLNEADHRILQEMIKNFRGTGNVKPTANPVLHTAGSPEVYVARPSSGKTFPARVNRKPGEALCDIFKLQQDGKKIVPVTYPDGTQKTLTAYNTWWYEFPWDFLIIKREKFGRWLVECCCCPNSSSSSSDASGAIREREDFFPGHERTNYSAEQEQMRRFRARPGFERA